MREDDDPEVVTRPELVEARTLFRAVLDAETSLQDDHASAAEAVLGIARAGSLAATMGRVDDALARFEELGDRLFEEGIYL